MLGYLIIGGPTQALPKGGMFDYLFFSLLLLLMFFFLHLF